MTSAEDRARGGRDDDDEDGSGIAHALTEDPVEIDGPSPSENSVLRTATALQSSTEPERYPKEKREEQLAAATGIPPDAADRSK